MANEPLPNDHFQVLLFKFCKSLEGMIANPEVALPNDHLQVLLYKATKNLQTYSGS